MSQQNRSCIKKERVDQILELLKAGRLREEIADQFGYSTWKSLDIYMRRHGFIWDGQNQIYTNSLLKTDLKDPSDLRSNDISPSSIEDLTFNPEEVVRLFGLGILDARDIAKRVGFSSHKEMAAYMLRRGYVWSPTTLNYLNTNASEDKLNLDTNVASKTSSETEPEIINKNSVSESNTYDKYTSLLEFLWQSRDKLIKIVESMTEISNINVYHVPGSAKTKSIYLSDDLSDLMIQLCEKHSLSQRQGYEAALVEFLRKYGFRDQVDKLINSSK